MGLPGTSCKLKGLQKNHVSEKDQLMINMPKHRQKETASQKLNDKKEPDAKSIISK